jgi:hypothetical protein
MIHNDCPKKIIIFWDDCQIEIDNPFTIELSMIDNKFTNSLLEMRIKFNHENCHEVYIPEQLPATTTDAELVPNRICNWCQEDISMIPEDSNNCCYCGSPLSEDDEEEKEGATKPAPGSQIPAEDQNNENWNVDYYPPMIKSYKENLIDGDEILNELMIAIEAKARALDEKEIPHKTIQDPKTGKFYIQYDEDYKMKETK